MRGRWNGGYIGAQQTPTAGSVRGIFNAAEMQQLSGASLWPQPANDPYFQYVTALLQGNGGPPTSATGTNTTNFNADASTNNFLLSLNGDVRNDEFHPYQQGYYSNYFDASGDSLATSSSATLTGDFTIECWINYQTASWVQGTILTVGNEASGRIVFFTTPTTISYNIFAGPGTVNIASFAFALNTWYHIAIVRSGTTLTAYVNGTSAGSVTLSGTLGNSTAYYIHGTSGGADTVAAYYSNLRLVNGTAVYTSSFTPSTTPLTAIANTSLLTCQSNRFIDNSPNNFTITRNGDVSVQYFQPFGQAALSAATFTNNQPSPGTNGYYGVYFDGTGDFLSLPNNSALNISSGDFTVECWFYVTNSVNTQTLFWLGGNTASYSTIRFGIDTNALNLYFGADSTSWAINQQGLGSVAAFTWYHAAVSRSGSSIRVFLNGTQVGSTITSSATFYAGSLYYLGALNYTDGGFPSYRVLNGYISNARVVKGTALYTSNFTPSTTPLTAVANTSLLTCQSATLIDNSTNNFTITANGDAKVTVAQPFTSTVAGSTVVTYGSAYFDGTGDWLSYSDTSILNFGTGAYTVEFWLYPPATPADFKALVYGGNFRIYQNSTNNFISLWNGVNTVVAGAIALVNNAWNHVAVVRTSTASNGCSIYVNGVPTVGTDATNWGATSGFIGYDGATAGRAYQGYMSNVRIIKGTAVYTANFIPPSMPVTAVSNTQLLSLQYNGGAMNSGFEDTGPYDFLVTRAGNVSQGTFTPYGSNWSNYFDGSGDFLTIPSNAALAFGTGAYTVEFWVYLSSYINASNRIMDLGQATGSFGIQINNTNTISITKSGSADLTASSASFTLNTWNHIAVVRTSTSANGTVYYLNGVNVGTITDNNDWTVVTTPRINGYSGFSFDFAGYLSNLRILKGTALYTSNFTPPTAPLTTIANTSLLTCQSNRFIDNSTNNFTITRNGDTSVQRFSPFRPTVAYNSATYSGSAYFDGTGDYLTLPVNQSALALGSSDFTFEAWVYRTSGTGTASIFAGQSDLNTAGGSAYVFYVSSTATTDLYVGGTGYGITSPNPALGQWAHVAYARTGGTFSSYLNGVRVGTRSDLGSSSVNVGNQANPAAIGGFSNASSLLTGYITDARLIKGSGGYNATLGTLTVPAAPLASTTNTSLLLNMANTGQYDNAMMVNWESAGNTQATPSFYKYGTGSLYFDGTGDYLSSTRVPAVGSGSFTIECWAYITGSVSNCGIWQFAASLFPASVSGLSVAAVSSSWQIYYGGTSASGGTAALNTWYHLALVRSGTNLRLYVNGTSVISVTDSTNYTGQAMSIGGYYTTGYLMTGYIDDFRITPGIARYTSNFTPPTSQFVNT